MTGGLGFLGSHVVRRLLACNADVRITTHRSDPPTSRDYEVIKADLTRYDDCRRAAKSMDLVFHLAAYGWGLGENVGRQSSLFTNNVLINTAMLDAAFIENVSRYLFTSSSSVYSGASSVLDDETPWNGDPHASELSFGWAKRIGEIQARIFAENNGMQIAIVRPSNPYGPHDDFHPTRAHVVPSLIVRAFERRNPFVVWGTGKVERSFIHADDVARALLLALEKYAVCDPVNVASCEVTHISDLARMVLDLSGHKDAEIAFDSTKPEGHPRKHLTTRKAEEKLEFQAKIGLRQGLQDTIEWYRSILTRRS